MLKNLGKIKPDHEFTTLDGRDRQTFLKNEKMVFSANPEFAYNKGGFMTKWCLEACEEAGMPWDDSVVIDTRVHMLKPGWWPSIPGWHCDAVPRDEDKQLLLNHELRDNIDHYLVVVDAGTGSMTEYLTDQVGLILPDEPDEGENLWATHSKLIKQLIDGGEYSTRQVESEVLYKFSAYDYHNATPATDHGWRFFFRASVNTQTKGPYNEVRNQVQVYVPSENFGW